MKGAILATGLCLTVMAAEARSVKLPSLPQGQEFADAVESVEYSFKAFDNDEYLASVEIGFDAVEECGFDIAFGTDANGDGDFSSDEVRLSAGIDSGRWFVMRGSERIEKPVDERVQRRYIDMCFSANEDGRLTTHTIDFGEDRLVAKDGLADAVAPDYRDWNICRITRRGVADLAECVVLKFLNFTPYNEKRLHIPNERPLFTNEELASRFGYKDAESGEIDGLSATRMLKIETGTQTNTYAVKFAKWAMMTPEFRRFNMMEKDIKSFLGISLADDVLGYGKESPKDGIVANGEHEFLCKPDKPYRAFMEVSVTRAMSPSRIGTITGSEHFASAEDADAEAVAIAEDIGGRFNLVPEVAVPGRVWIMQTPRILILLVRGVVDGEEAVALTLHDKQAHSMYISLGHPERFYEE